jgi:hypothetical protein
MLWFRHGMFPKGSCVELFSVVMLGGGVEVLRGGA